MSMTMPPDRSADTTPEAERVRREVLRRIGPEGRVRLAFELSELVRAAAEQGIRWRHPEYDERRVRLAWFRLTLGAEPFRKLFPGEEVEP